MSWAKLLLTLLGSLLLWVAGTIVFDRPLAAPRPASVALARAAHRRLAPWRASSLSRRASLDPVGVAPQDSAAHVRACDVRAHRRAGRADWSRPPAGGGAFHHGAPVHLALRGSQAEGRISVRSFSISSVVTDPVL